MQEWLSLAEQARQAGLFDALRQSSEAMLHPDAASHFSPRVMDFLVSAVQPVAGIVAGVTYHRIAIDPPYGCHVANPAIHPQAASREALLRFVDYAIVPSGYDYSSDPVPVTSVTWNVRFGNDHAVVAATRLEAGEHHAPHPGSIVRGFEDCRPFTFAGREFALAVARDWSPLATCRMMLLDLETPGVPGVIPLSFERDGHQKNWMPVTGRDDLVFVKLCYPLVLTHLDVESGVVSEVRREDTSPLLAWFRGGSCLVPFDDGYLAVIHEVISASTAGNRIYVHRFVYFDSEIRPVSCTDQFCFMQKGIEFVAGLRVEGDSLVVSFGVLDREGWLAVIPADQIRSRLVPIEERIMGDPVGILRDALASGTGLVREQSSRSGSVSVTLCGDASAPVLGDALRSVLDQVDSCLVVNTGETDAVEKVAREVAGAKAIIRHLPWPNDFARARNASLAFAAETGAAWAVILDADERIHFGDHRLANVLDRYGPEITHVSMASQEQAYAKPRMIRLPAVPSYTGQTHEYLSGGRDGGRIQGMVFSELPKTEEQLRHKSERDIAILEKVTMMHPAESRWHYYLGDAYQNSGQDVAATRAFHRCAETDGWDEERAWACYREAQSWMKLNQPERALDVCARGLGIHPGIAELAWMAGFVCWNLKRDAAAIEWSHLAIVHGEFRGRANRRQRIGFRYLPALYESPFDVLRYSYRRLGDDAGADQAEADFQEALAARLALYQT